LNWKQGGGGGALTSGRPSGSAAHTSSTSDRSLTRSAAYVPGSTCGGQFGNSGQLPLVSSLPHPTAYSTPGGALALVYRSRASALLESQGAVADPFLPAMPLRVKTTRALTALAQVSTLSHRSIVMQLRAGEGEHALPPTS